MQTFTERVDASSLGTFNIIERGDDLLDRLEISLGQSIDADAVRRGAELLTKSCIPVAFPTETVYGLGADATRTEAVRGIYTAKQRPSDNPLIVHFASLDQLRAVLTSTRPPTDKDDPIPTIYHSLIKQFWPGPLTLILPTPSNSVLAPEVTAGLDTFGARIPRHPIALALIELAGVPVAAPSANTSTKPSPTAAEHVAADLDGRIELILDGGPCAVGVESTVVDGLCSPPCILRPGGISIEQIRRCPGWEAVVAVYKDAAESGAKPRAPGMKYRHYSPKAPVILYEAGKQPPSLAELKSRGGPAGVGLLTTRRWSFGSSSSQDPITFSERPSSTNGVHTLVHTDGTGFAGLLKTMKSDRSQLSIDRKALQHEDGAIEAYYGELGHSADDIARRIFAALRALDDAKVEAIFVEGIEDDGDDLAAAVMNRLRKAASVVV